MSVPLERGRRLPVAKLGGDVGEWGAVREEEGRDGVAEVVEGMGEGQASLL
jgi:hypothetical protein